MEWRTLATKALTVRGERLDPASIWFDADALRRWNLANLDGYWVAKTDEGERVRPEFWARWGSGLQWVVLGVPRLHHTIVTNDVISKSAASAYALDMTDERLARRRASGAGLAGRPAGPTTEGARRTGR